MVYQGSGEGARARGERSLHQRVSEGVGKREASESGIKYYSRISAERAQKSRLKLEEEKLALISFVRDIDHLNQKSTTANYTPGGVELRGKRAHSLDGNTSITLSGKFGRFGASLLAETPEIPEEDEIEDLLAVEMDPGSPLRSTRDVLGEKENLPL